MYKIISDYLDSATSGIRGKRRREALREELNAHIREHMERIVAGGATEDEAARQAIAAMGESSELAKQISGRRGSFPAMPVVAGAFAALVLATLIAISGGVIWQFVSAASLYLVVVFGGAIAVAPLRKFNWHGFWRNLSSSAILAGVLGVVTSMIIMCGRLSAPEMIGPSVSVALISLFYGLLLSAAARIAVGLTNPHSDASKSESLPSN
jgi:hypothetical protein